MAYSVFGDVRIRCDTDIADADITTMIQETDAWLDWKVGAVNMAAMAAALARLLSATRTAIMCYLKDPEDQKLGEYAESRAYALKKLNTTFDELLEDVLEELGLAAGIGFQYHYEALPRGYRDYG